MVRTGGEGAKRRVCLRGASECRGVFTYGKAEEKMGWNAQPTQFWLPLKMYAYPHKTS